MARNRRKKYFLITIRGGDMTTRSSDSTRIIKIGPAMTTTIKNPGGASSNTAELRHCDYCLVRVEELQQIAAAQQTRASTTRYTGPDDLSYRVCAEFVTGFRIRLQGLGGSW